MGCCLSREDDRFDSGNEALLPKGRNGNKRVARQAFLAWDANRDGRICAKELRDMLSRLGIARVLGQMKVNVILQHVLARPTAATLKLKLKEFAARLNDAYAEFDDDHNGYLSYSELCVGLKELGLNLTEREFLHLATRVDADGNGEICFKEFCHVFGSDGAVNRRCQSARTGDEEDKRVEEKSAKTQLKHGSQRQRAAGTFNFSHLTR
ncbi:hypothetical protein AM588_10008104 [Phytophthora nicotianae]|uniref:EF-hand domain-containing protein n=1 Tax=Phytophthora nicotianae TaxID=4792 RepID=A0A0W8DID0_PHYNI|nr:hypothetical protein AM588_10008104 [Phytophthora nicotianae]